MPICPKCEKTSPVLGAQCPDDGYYYVYDDALRDQPADPRLGTLIADRFAIIGLVSKGGMGAVYRALQLPVEREVALKVLLTELERSHKGRKRFVREAKAISRLSHPNIITLHDFGFADNDQPFMVMEYAPGQELGDWSQAPDVTLERLIYVCRQILSALADSHDNDIIHRDLKPQNIIITKTGNDTDFAKLLDFGIARLIDDRITQGLTRDGEVFGTPYYMSPEQARGDSGTGPEADVYAMGIMLYELFCGQVPFDAQKPLQVLFMHINDPLPELVPRPGLHLPEGLDEVIRRATEKAPEDRYANAGEMLFDFDKTLGISRSSGTFSLEIKRPIESADDDLATAPTQLIQSLAPPSSTDSSTAEIVAGSATEQLHGDVALGHAKTQAQQRSQKQNTETLDRGTQKPSLDPRTQTIDPAPEDVGPAPIDAAIVNGDSSLQEPRVVEETVEHPRSNDRTLIYAGAAAAVVLGLMVILIVAIMMTSDDEPGATAEPAAIAGESEETPGSKVAVAGDESPDETPEVEAEEISGEPDEIDDTDKDDDEMAAQASDDAPAETPEPPESTAELEESEPQPGDHHREDRHAQERRDDEPDLDESAQIEEPAEKEEAPEVDEEPPRTAPTKFERPSEGPSKFDRPQSND